MGELRTKGSEGCLSVPDIRDEVERAQNITIQALNTKGETFTLTAEGLLAICIQHELDHLNGRVFVQYLSKLKQDRIATKLKKSAQRSHDWCLFPPSSALCIKQKNQLKT